MKKVHLICNAHIDPIWQWDWQEGVSAVISTFKSAVNLAKDFDYIFCHNEVTVYKYVEEYAPDLFEEIKELVRKGKWHIMGGWYLQPDCTMPSGESFVRQIKTGQKYFKEKFGVVPTTAINFDPFGHTRGLVQIMAKSGQDSYLFMRPFNNQLELESEQFIWVGFDGSEIKANRTTVYNSPLGHSVDKIKKDIHKLDYPVIASLWGVGNHGGGPSRSDLKQISEFLGISKEEEIEVLHSTPEGFFADIAPTERVEKSLYSAMPGCYITMSRLKRLHIELENKLYFAEKICSAAAINGLMAYPAEKLNSVTEDLLNGEFHDVLPGTVIKSGEENGIMILHHGLLDAEKMTTRAFFAMLATEKPAREGEYPVFAFNPHPYEFDTDIECEFMLADQNFDTESVSFVKVYDDNNNLLTSQVIKEESNINVDWRKRIIFPAKLKPMSINRFRFEVDYFKQDKKIIEDYIVKDDRKYIEIDRKTGLLKSFCIDGKEYIHNAFQPISFDDNADPWAMSAGQLKRIGDNPQSFRLCEKPQGVFGGLKSIEVIENGDIFLCVEAFFEKDNSKVQVKYKVYKNRDFVDVDVTVFWQDIDKVLRLAIPMKTQGKLIGQTAYGTDDMFMDGRENVSHRFIALENNSECLAVFNNCTYGSMYENGILYISLLRGAAYCTHPIPDRQLVPENRYIKRIDQCEHTYSFRIAVAKREDLERMALEFNQKPFVQNVFPIATKSETKEKSLVIDNKNIVLAAMKKSDDVGFILRLFNNSENKAQTDISIGDAKAKLNFEKYEVKTVVFDGEFKETN
ncbi:MAG: alpha-mannosidase, partial [Clostridia bacterium]|nr:alpha-mannosidase [Clostridia bacterium]